MAKKSKAKKDRPDASIVEEPGFMSRMKATWETKKTIIIYLAAFFLFITLFFWVGEQDFFNKIQKPITNIFASVSGMVLSLFGFDMNVNGDLLASPELRLRIKKGCDAIAPAMIYAVAVIAFPVLWKYKWKGLLYGLLAIFVLNVIRIVSLFLTGIYAQSIFDLMHLDIWQVLFIFATLFFWLIWLRWALKKENDINTPNIEEA